VVPLVAQELPGATALADPPGALEVPASLAAQPPRDIRPPAPPPSDLRAMTASRPVRAVTPRRAAVAPKAARVVPPKARAAVPKARVAAPKARVAAPKAAKPVTAKPAAKVAAKRVSR
jgi:hypothetical protein